MVTSSSLLQGVLRPNTSPSTENYNIKVERYERDESDDELVGVTSVPGTPSRSRPPSRPSSRPSSRQSSPTRTSASKRPAPGPLLLPKHPAGDPLRAFPTEVGQRIFGALTVRDLARCARVCKKWSRSQTLNYVWFQISRKDALQDEDLSPGKWTRRESKQNWRLTYIQNVSQRDRDLAQTSFSRSSSRPSTPTGYQTPREMKEEQWRTEAEAQSKPGKLEMREMYKELGGRKLRGKGKLGGATRDKGGWAEVNENGW